MRYDTTQHNAATFARKTIRVPAKDDNAHTHTFVRRNAGTSSPNIDCDAIVTPSTARMPNKRMFTRFGLTEAVAAAAAENPCGATGAHSAGISSRVADSNHLASRGRPALVLALIKSRPKRRHAVSCVQESAQGRRRTSSPRRLIADVRCAAFDTGCLTLNVTRHRGRRAEAVAVPPPPPLPATNCRFRSPTAASVPLRCRPTVLARTPETVLASVRLEHAQ